MTTIISIIFLVCFAGIAWKKFHWALGMFFALLPTYLIRFSIWSVPTTLLELMIAILTLRWIIYLYTKKSDVVMFSLKWWSRQHTLLLAMSLCIIGATLAIFFASNTRAALGEWKAFYLEPIIMMVVIATSIRTKQQLKLILSFMIVGALITSTLAIYQHFTGFFVPHAFWANRNTYRVTGWYGFPNAVGLFLAPLLPLAFYLIQTGYTKKLVLTHTNKLRVLLSLLFVPISILAIFYAKSTGALVGIVAGIGTLFLFNKKTRWPTLILGCVGLVSIFLIPADNALKQELLLQDRSGQLRVDMWRETTQLLTKHPLIGAGLASYSEQITPYRTDKTIEVFHHPHNLFLTLWVNIGVVGLCGFVLLIGWFYTRSISLWKKEMVSSNESILPYLVSSMTIILVMGLVDSPYIKNDLAILFWFFPALFIAQLQTSRSSSTI